MIKKSVVAAAGVLLLLSLIYGRSHVTTAVGIAKDKLDHSMSIPFELQRARDEVKRLAPEVERNMRAIAEVEVDVAKLEREVGKAEDRLKNDHNEILQLKGDLDSGSEVFVYAGRNYSAEQVKTDLIRRFDHFKTQEATLVSKKKQLDAKQRMLLAAREKLEGMLAARSQLEVDVENLAARQKMIEVAQTTSEFNFDDSQLASTKELIDRIRTRVEVSEKLVNAEVDYFDRIPLNEQDVDRDISNEITDYFGDHRPEVESLVESLR